VVGECLGVLERALVLEVGGDAGRAEGMIADLGLDARRRAPLDHPIHVLLSRGGVDTDLDAQHAELSECAVAAVGEVWMIFVLEKIRYGIFAHSGVLYYSWCL
jgi:hypothetical protein